MSSANHSDVVYGKHPHYKALNLVAQCLEELGLEKTRRELIREAHLEDEVTDLEKGGILLSALALYEEIHSSHAEDEPSGKKAIDSKRAEFQNLLLSYQHLEKNPVQKCIRSLNGAHNSNIINAKFCPISCQAYIPEGLKIVLSTSVDGKFVFSDIDTEEVLSSIPKVASGAVLALEFNPVFTSIAAAGCMNGDVLVFDWEKLFLSGLGEENQNYLIDTFKDHGVKHVLSVKWSDDGVFLATASNDHSLQVYRRNENEEFAPVKSITFRETPESIHFIENALVVGTRGENFLQFLDLETFQQSESLNMNLMSDLHVSFTPLNIAYEPLSKFIAVSTDTSRSILLQRGVPGPVASLYGAINDEYSIPRAVFGNSGNILYSTSQDNAIVAWDLGSQKVIHRLEGHSKQVRDLDHHPRENQLLSCSFDRTVKLWGN